MSYERKKTILDLLSKFINQRPGLEFGNYGEVKAYRAEVRQIGRDLAQARTLLMAVERASLTDADLERAFSGAFSGRLVLTETRGGSLSLDYCTGQYFPTEYRKAACAVLASALWDFRRANMPAPVGYRVESWMTLEGRMRGQIQPTREAAEAELSTKGGSEYGSVCEVYPSGLSAGAWLRRSFVREFGRGFARWFN